MASITRATEPDPVPGPGFAGGRHVDRRLRLSSVLRVFERELHIYRRLWYGSVFSNFIGPSLFLGAMGIGLGGLIQARTNGIAGLTYLQFLAPGLLAATVMQGAAGNAMWPVLGGMKWTRHFHAMAVTPLRPAEIYTGDLLWLAMLMTVSGTAFLMVAAVLGGLASIGSVLALPAAVLTGLAFAAPIMAFSATQETDSRFALLMRFLVQPLFLFSGTFFPINQLPVWLQPVAWFSPLWHGIELCRVATTGGWGTVGAPMILLHLAVLIAVVFVGWWCGTRAFAKRLGA